MPALDFLNDNSNRGYPFLEDVLDMSYSGGGEVALPDATIVEATFLLGLHMDFDEARDSVYLYEIARHGDTLLFRFRFSPGQLAGYELEFCRTQGDAEFATSHASISPKLQSASLGTTCDALVSEGWLTTGKLDAIFTILADGQWLRRADGELRIEPARVQSLASTYINTINLANQDRARIPSADCVVTSSTSLDDTTSATILPQAYLVNAVCLDGPLRFRAGFNCNIQQDSLSNTITIGGQVGGGLGEPCSEVPLYAGEVPPDGSQFLSGGPGCNDVIKTINGVGGSHILFLSGLGVRVLADPNNHHKLLVDIDLHGLAVCPTS